MPDVTVFVLFFAVLLRIAFILGLVWLVIPKRKLCPHCGDPTSRLVTNRWMRATGIQRRWCPCGWSGVARRVVIPPAGTNTTDRWHRRTTAR